jgi:hypothetical protein
VRLHERLDPLKILNTLHFLLCRRIALLPFCANSAKGLNRVRPSSVFQTCCNGGTWNIALQISLVCTDRNHEMFANFACSFAFLLGIKPLWSVFSHFARCFPVSSVFPVFLGVSRFLAVLDFARCFPFCSEFLVWVGAAKIMNRNSHS